MCVPVHARRSAWEALVSLIPSEGLAVVEEVNKGLKRPGGLRSVSGFLMVRSARVYKRTCVLRAGMHACVHARVCVCVLVCVSICVCWASW